MILVNTVDTKFFTLDGVKFAKIYQPLAQGSQAIGLYSIYDTKQQLQNSTKYDEFLIDGVGYGSQEATIAALLDVVYSAVSDYDVEQLENRVDNLEENQYSGVVVYSTYAELPNPGTLLVSYKVSNDPISSNNGYYHWDGAAYVKDATLANGVIEEGDTDPVSGDTVYEEFIEQKRFMPDFVIAGKNLLNPEDVILDEYVAYSEGGGVVGIGNNPGWISTNYIKVKENTEYSASFAVQSDSAYAFFDENFNFLGGVVPSQLPTFTTLPNTAYVRTNMQTSGSFAVDVQLEESSTVTSYEEFRAAIKAKGSPSFVELLYNTKSKTAPTDPEHLIRLQEFDKTAQGEEKVVSDNLFNPVSYVSGQYIQDSTGQPSSSYAPASRTNLIEVQEGQHLFFAGYGDYFKLHTYSGSNFSDWIQNKGTLTDYVVEAGVTHIAMTLTLSDGNDYSGTFQINLDSLKAYDSYETGLLINDDVFINKKNVIGLEGGETNIKVVSIANSDKIVVFGNSYTQGYSLAGKHYLQKLGMLLDYQFRNFGKSGDDIIEIMQRIRANSTWFGSIPIKQFYPTYGIIACRDNNGTLSQTKPDTYFENAKKLAREIEALGGKPILSSEHQWRNEGEFTGFDRLVKEDGYLFMNWGKFAERSFANNYFQPLWNNNHPASRTNDLWALNMIHWLRTLPRPKNGIKVFRKRSDVVVADIDTDLMFETNIERAKLFEEIYTGHSKLTAATEKYVDRLDYDAYESQNCEYLRLQAGQSVNVNDYALLECITESTSNGLTQFDLFIAASNVSKVYVKKVLDLSAYNDPVDQSDPFDPYYSTFENPLGEWQELTEDTEIEGKYNLPESMFKDVVNFDKIVFLIESTGSDISMTNVYFQYAGKSDKKNESGKYYEIKEGTELLANTKLDSGWTNTGTPSVYVPVVDPDNPANIEQRPYGITTVLEIDDSNYIEQALNSYSDEYREGKFQLRILCRYFPEFVDQDAKWNSSHPLYGDKYFYADLDVILKNTAFYGDDKITLSREPVGLYWHEIIIEGTLANESGNVLILKSNNSKGIQIAKVNVTLY